MRASLLGRGIVVGIAILAAVKAVAVFQAAPLGAAAAAAAGPHQQAAQMQPSPARTAPVAVPAAASAARLATVPAEPSPAEPPADAAVATALRARREAVEERERALATREAVSAAAERRLSARITELGALQTALETQEKKARDRDEATWRTLARLYEAMRPREAAAIFNELDMPILIQVVNRMAERKAAPILGTMQPERVRLLTAELARLRTDTATP